MPLDAPEVVIKNLIRDAWTPANALTVTPYIHHGWLESEESDEGEQVSGASSAGPYYEVTVSDPDESPVNGGQTGYSGIDPTGAGPTQEIGGTVEVNVWSQRGRVGVNGNGGSANPRQLVYLMKAEVERILHAHYDGTTDGGAGTDLNFLAPLGARRIPDEAEVPIMYRYQVTAGYGYKRRP